MSFAENEDGSIKVVKLIGVALATLAALILLIMAFVAGGNAFGRWQKQAEAQNNVKVAKIEVETARVKAENQVKITEIQIKNQEQRVLIAKQQAQIRLEQAKGIRAAQDEVSKTLTPLYVQMELSKSLEAIAKSGKNSSVIYIPTGPNGLPVTSVAPTK